MKLQHLSLTIGLITSSAIALTASPAQAFNFTGGTHLGACSVLTDNFSIPNFKAFLDNTTGVQTCKTLDGFTLTASQPTNGYLQGKMVDKDKKVKGIGISVPFTGKTPPPVPGEIQFGERLNAVLNIARRIQSIDLGFLYPKGVFGDKVNEAAEITAHGPTGTVKGTLTVTSKTSAIWSLGGLVINLDPSIEVEGGAYKILNPFGNILVSSLGFTAPNNPNILDPQDSDYSLIGIEAYLLSPTGVYVPEPANLLGLSLLGGLMVAARRPKKSPW